MKAMPRLLLEVKILNSCLLIAKTTIYKSKNHNTQPNLSKFVFDLCDYILIEENISIKNNTYSIFEAEWGDIVNQL